MSVIAFRTAGARHPSPARERVRVPAANVREAVMMSVVRFAAGFTLTLAAGALIIWLVLR
jgi:hypothetical protein